MIKKYTESIYSFLNAISTVSFTLLNGLLGAFAIRLIILKYGSDFNGLNSTATQIVNMLLVLEGGFTVASNVALFEPLVKNDLGTVNGILAATRKRFRIIGMVFLLIGCLVAFLYPLFINSELPYTLVMSVIIMAVFPNGFNLCFASTFRVLLQAQKKDYILKCVSMLTIIAGHLLNIAILLFWDCPNWVIRFVTMVFATISGVAIIYYTQKHNKFINLSAQPLMDKIKGTNDVVIQKVTGVIYGTAPVVFLSASNTGGTMLTSVYSVYAYFFSIIYSLLYSFIVAPSFSFGQLLTTKIRDEIWRIFYEYEYVIFSMIFVLFSTGALTVLPFVKLYTKGIDDIIYYDPLMATLTFLISLVGLLHIPSGTLMNMAGEFKASKKIQISACFILLILLPLSAKMLGVYGILFSVLATAIILAFLEIGFIHLYFFEKKIVYFVKLLSIFSMIGLVTFFFENTFFPVIESYFELFLFSLLFFFVHVLIAATVGFLFFEHEFMNFVQRCRLIISALFS